LGLNDENLIEFIKRYEIEFGPKIAAGYEGLMGRLKLESAGGYWNYSKLKGMEFNRKNNIKNKYIRKILYKLTRGPSRIDRTLCEMPAE
jgi:hypothetical protein